MKTIYKRIIMSVLGVFIGGISVVCVVLGVILFMLAGGTLQGIPTIAGVGTIITAFFMGPLIELFNKKISRPFLCKGNGTPQ